MGKHAETKPPKRYSMPAHPATAPAVITAALVLLVVGLGWLNSGDEPGQERLAVPLASGAGAAADEGDEAGDEGGDDRVVWPWASPEEGGRSLPDGRPFVTENWLDIPLVAPALVLQPSAVGTIIPGVTVAPGTATGTTGLDSAPDGGPGSGSGGSGGSTSTSRPRTGPASTVTTRPGGTPGTPTTATPTTEPPVTAPPTTETPTTTPPTTETPTTNPPTTEPPPTTPPPTDPPVEPSGGLLDSVDDLLGGVVGGLGGVLGLGG